MLKLRAFIERMASFNKVILMGNLTRDPELKTTSKGQSVCDLYMAVNETYKDSQGVQKESVVYVDVSVWGRQAEACKEHLSKGSSALVEGRLKLDQWEKDGEKKSKLRVQADRVQFIGAPRGVSGSTPRPEQQPQNQEDGSDRVPF